MEELLSVLGYHKTRQSYASSIYSSKTFPISTGLKMWLGDGVYFWDSLDNAIWWNKDLYKDGVILSARLQCNTGKFIDLDDPNQMEIIVRYAESILSKISKDATVNIDFKNRIQARAFFCTLFKRENEIKLIKHSFPWLTNNAAGFRSVQYRTQYCATDNSVISDIAYVTSKSDKHSIGESYEYI